MVDSPFRDLHREAARGAVPERNGKKLADGQLLLKLFRHFVSEEPIERQVDGDPCKHQSFMNSGGLSSLELSNP